MNRTTTEVTDFLSIYHTYVYFITIPLQACYNTYGVLNETRDNVIVVCHALTGNSRLDLWWGSLLGGATPISSIHPPHPSIFLIPSHHHLSFIHHHPSSSSLIIAPPHHSSSSSSIIINLPTCIHAYMDGCRSRTSFRHLSVLHHLCQRAGLLLRQHRSMVHRPIHWTTL